MKLWPENLTLKSTWSIPGHLFIEDFLETFITGIFIRLEEKRNMLSIHYRKYKKFSVY